MLLSTFKRRARARRAMALMGRNRPWGARKRVGKQKLRGFTAQQSKSIRRAIAGKEETKYIATQLALNQLVDPAIHTPGTDILPLVPKVQQGTNEFQRVGRKIAPSKCRVDIALTFPDVEQGNTLPSNLHNAAEIYAVMYVLRSKVIKNWDTYATTTEYQNLLDNGAGQSQAFGFIQNPGTGSAFWTTNSSFLQYPIESSHYTLLKKKVVKLVRNTGGMFDGAGWATNSPQSAWRGSFSYKLPTLYYDDTPLTVPIAYPTNTNVMLAVGYVFANNLNAEAVDPDGAETQFTPPQLLSITVRNHIWFKDA